MLQLLEPKWVEAVRAYCQNRPEETLEITYYMMQYVQDKSSTSKRDGRLYVSLNGDAVDGLAFFNVKGVMYISFSSDGMFKKVDFLKAIHKEQPTLIRGVKEQVERVFYFLQRVLKDFNFTPTQLMVYKPSSTVAESGPLGLSGQDGVNLRCFHENLEPDQDIAVVPAHKVDWLLHAKFLMAVEQHFRTQTLTLNNLRHKIHNRVDFDFYHIAMHFGQVVGQLICEFSTEDYGIIGGLFVQPSFRNQGYASVLCQTAAAQICAMGKTPALYVATSNTGAIALYQKLGFVVANATLDLSIKL